LKKVNENFTKNVSMPRVEINSPTALDRRSSKKNNALPSRACTSEVKALFLLEGDIVAEAMGSSHQYSKVLRVKGTFSKVPLRCTRQSLASLFAGGGQRPTKPHVRSPQTAVQQSARDRNI